MKQFFNIKKLLPFLLFICFFITQKGYNQTYDHIYSYTRPSGAMYNGNNFTLNGFSSCQDNVTITIINFHSLFYNSTPCTFNNYLRVYVDGVAIASGLCGGSVVSVPSQYLPVTDIKIEFYHSGAGATWDPNIQLKVGITVTSPTASMPTSPPTTNNINYCYGDTAVPLTATFTGSGSSLKWYTAATGGMPSFTAPTPNTTISGTTSYWVSQADATGCESVRTEIIATVYPQITTSAGSQNNIYCNGDSNGSATVSVSGGTPGYTYSWSPSGGTGATATGLSAGTYTVTITDANNCTAIQSFTITEPTALASAISSQTNVGCNGNANGSATVTASGGTAPYTYLWSDGQVTATANNLVAGTYVYWVTDTNGCVSSNNVIITEPAALASSISSQTNVDCNGSTSGSATVTVSGGTTPYLYSWSNGDNTATTNNLTAGSYTYTITDANGCSTTGSVTITEPTALASAISSQTNMNCNGNANGSATVTASGGTAPYTYLWSDGQVTATANNLVAGTYVYWVTDANGCVSSNNVIITEPAALTSSISSQTNVDCNGSPNGSATVTVSGGTTPYLYSWSNGDNTATTNNLTAGSYTYTITDANGCSTTGSVTITEPTALASAISSQTNMNCNGSANGSATVTVSGGTAPYTYLWSDGQVTATANNLVAGTYVYWVTDANGCVSSNNVIITEPTALTSSISSQTNVDCNGSANGSTTVTASGGTAPYTYLWSDGQVTATANNLVAGTYVYWVTDANGCVSSNNVIITEPAAVGLPTVSNVAYCLNETTSSLTATLTGTGASLLWYTTANGGVGSTTAPTPSSSTAGTFSYWVSQTNSNGCEGDRQQLDVTVTPSVQIITQPQDQTITETDNLIFTVTETNATSYQWEVSMDNGSTWNTLNDAITNPDVSGSTTSTLTVSGNNMIILNGYLFRVILGGTSPCGNVTSNSALATVTLRANDFSTDNGIKIYPNPFQNKVIIAFDESIDAELKVFDVNGRLLKDQKLNATENNIDMSNLPSGLYLFQITSDSKTMIQKVIKK